MDGLNKMGDTVLEAHAAYTLRREEAFEQGLNTIHPGTNYHVSPVQKSGVTFSYHTIDARYNDRARPSYKARSGRAIFPGGKNGYWRCCDDPNSSPLLAAQPPGKATPLMT